MTTWQAPQSRPLSLHNIVLGVAIGLAILCAVITLVVVLERQRSEPGLGSAVARMNEARDELQTSAAALREATAALQAATRAPTTVNIMSPTPDPAIAQRNELRAAMHAITDNLAPEPALYCADDTRCTLPRAALEQALANPSTLAEQARVLPSVRDGQVRGLKLYGIRPGSLPRLLGFKNGDLIKTINGLPLGGIEQAMVAYAKLGRSDKLTLEIERKGQPLSKEITIE